jgi:hypothetical protein
MTNAAQRSFNAQWRENVETAHVTEARRFRISRPGQYNWQAAKGARFLREDWTKFDYIEIIW